MKKVTKEDIPLSPPIPSPEESGPIGTELVFPMQSIPLVVAGIPESFLPLCGPEAQSCYRCQFPDCAQIFLQKAAACTHIHCDPLNVALACLYYSGKKNPKCSGSVLQLGRTMFVSIHKMASLYFPMTLPLPIYPQRPYPPLLVPPPNLFHLMLF